MEEIRASCSYASEWCVINPILGFNVAAMRWVKKNAFWDFIFHLWFQNVVTSFYKCYMCLFIPLSFELSCCSCVINILLTLIYTVLRSRSFAWTRAQLSHRCRSWGGKRIWHVFSSIPTHYHYPQYPQDYDLFFRDRTQFDGLYVHLYH